MLLLEMFMEGDMGVDPKAGLATLERFIADFTEILKEFLRKITNNKKKK